MTLPSRGCRSCGRSTHHLHQLHHLKCPVDLLSEPAETLEDLGNPVYRGLIPFILMFGTDGVTEDGLDIDLMCRLIGWLMYSAVQVVVDRLLPWINLIALFLLNRRF